MEGTVLNPEVALEKLQRIRRMWLRKAMVYIYEMFFHDETMNVHSKRNTTLLVTVILLAAIVGVLFGLKFYTYIKYRRAITAQIQVVNAKWQSMLISFDILRKIVGIHSSIVTSQLQIDQLKMKRSSCEVEQSCENLEGDSSNVCTNVESTVGLQNCEEDRRTEFLKRPKHEKILSRKNKAYSTKIEKDPKSVSKKESMDKLPQNRKSKTRYTVQSAKAQSNLTSQPSDGKIADVREALASASSKVELEEFYVSNLKMLDSLSSIDISKSLDLVCFKDSVASMQAFTSGHSASATDDDVEVSCDQFFELLNNLEQGKRVDIASLVNILMTGVSDKLNKIKGELLQF